jgi:hypothetical protein
MKTIGELKQGDKAYYFNRTKNCLIEFEIDKICIDSTASDYFSVYIKGTNHLNYKRGLPPIGFSIHRKYLNKTFSKSITTVNSNESIKNIENNRLSSSFYDNNKRFRRFYFKFSKKASHIGGEYVNLI